jgi:hypothetical protein
VWEVVKQYAVFLLIILFFIALFATSAKVYHRRTPNGIFGTMLNISVWGFILLLIGEWLFK